MMNLTCKDPPGNLRDSEGCEGCELFSYQRQVGLSLSAIYVWGVDVCVRGIVQLRYLCRSDIRANTC